MAKVWLLSFVWHLVRLYGLQMYAPYGEYAAALETVTCSLKLVRTYVRFVRILWICDRIQREIILLLKYGTLIFYV